MLLYSNNFTQSSISPQRMQQSHSFMPSWHTYSQPPPSSQPQPLLQKPHMNTFVVPLAAHPQFIQQPTGNVAPLMSQQQMPGSRRFSAGGVTQRSPSGFGAPQTERRQNKVNFRKPQFNGNSNPTAGLYQAPRGNVGDARSSNVFHANHPPYSGRNSFNQQLTPQSQSVAKTGLYNVTGSFLPGMKDVPLWLKSLRLHKYTRLFQEMPYDEMMALNDQRLEQRQVTKGARKKILQSLAKLKDRSQLIRQLEKSIDEYGDVRCLIVELRAMMHTPIAMYLPKEHPKPSNYMIDAIGIPALEVPDENLPGHIARLCMRLHDYLFQNGQPQIEKMGLEDEYVLKLLQVYDKLLANEAFTYRQKYCIHHECRRVLLRYAHEHNIVANQSGLGTPIALSALQHVDFAMNSPDAQSSSSQYRRNSDPRESDDLLTTGTSNTTSNSDDDLFMAALNGCRTTHSAPTSPMPPTTTTNNTHGVIGTENLRDSPAHTQTSSSAHSSNAMNDSCWQNLHRPQAHTQASKLNSLPVPPGFQPLPQDQQPTNLWTDADKLKFIIDNDNTSEILDMAVRLTMCKLKQQREPTTTNSTGIWQNNHEKQQQRPIVSQTSSNLPSRWWADSQPAKSRLPQAPSKLSPTNQQRNLYAQNDYSAHRSTIPTTNTVDFYDPWHEVKPATNNAVIGAPAVGAIGQVRSVGASMTTSGSSSESSNTLGKMLNDCFVGQKSQAPQSTSQWIMQQYAHEPTTSWTRNEENLRAVLGDSLFGNTTDPSNHSTSYYGPTFRPLPCSASGAVH
ncbi:Protein Smaug [Aphelenchoides besseyi]|nr:Protein Smaug [Aphelenchoides besseyi]KAI6202248.1 Protein Smaug [Aphelenchoides besseyi]